MVEYPTLDIKKKSKNRIFSMQVAVDVFVNIFIVLQIDFQ